MSGFSEFSYKMQIHDSIFVVVFLQVCTSITNFVVWKPKVAHNFTILKIPIALFCFELCGELKYRCWKSVIILYDSHHYITSSATYPQIIYDFSNRLPVLSRVCFPITLQLVFLLRHPKGDGGDGY